MSGVPPNYDDSVLFRIHGSLFVYPVRIRVQGRDCPRVTLVEPSPVVCYNVSITSDQSHSHYVCDAMSTEVTCELPRLFGINMDVVVISGRGGEIAETDESRTDSRSIVLTSAAPVIMSVQSADCHADQPLSLSDCPVNHTFALTICAASDSIAYNSTLEVLLAGRAIVNCSMFDIRGQAMFCGTCASLPAVWQSAAPCAAAADSGAAQRHQRCPVVSRLSGGHYAGQCSGAVRRYQPLLGLSCGLIHHGQQRTDAVHAVSSWHIQQCRRC